MSNLNLDQIIRELQQYVESRTSDKVCFEIKNDIQYAAFINFPKWLNEEKKKLPKIILKENVDKVHILHEIIHLEKFFIDKYPIIVCTSDDLHSILKIFKCITEDYIVHKEIKNKYALNPIDKEWFKGRDNLQNNNDLEIAANLVSYWAFSEFVPEYKAKYDEFLNKAKRNRIRAYIKASSAIGILNGVNYKNVSAFNECTEKIVKIFVPDYYKKGDIYPATIKRNTNGYWEYEKCLNTE